MMTSQLTASDLIGRKLVGLHYDVFVWETEPDSEATIDGVPGAVLITLDEVGVCLRWELYPPSEQLLMTRQTKPIDHSLYRRRDASQRWRQFLGAEITEVSWSMHETGDGVQPWAVTFLFGNRGGMVVALGEVLNGRPSYLPDSLVVMADRQLALQYFPPAALSPAWTEGAHN